MRGCSRGSAQEWVLKRQATKQVSSQALRRHSVGAMPCRGLLYHINIAAL